MSKTTNNTALWAIDHSL